MQINSIFKNIRIRKLRIKDIKQVYKLLLLNRPYVVLNSKYTYFLLARDFSDTCVVIKKDEKIIRFSSGYISPSRPDTFFSWESVVDKNYRGNNFQKLMFLYQIKLANSKFFE